ncbi:hypothetical protein BJ742DRAFT_374166 [Cladochytrium replicatum]|nr:hypothetical protein BJ742DRAFT_374166 [Cladochytrium replicatum]
MAGRCSYCGHALCCFWSVLNRPHALARKVDKQERNLLENFGDLATLTFPALLILAPHLLRALTNNTLDLSLKPLPIIWGTYLIYICFDVIYYFVHRAFHEVPFLYQHIHKRHHEELPVHVYLTARASYLENLLAVTPGLCIWILTTNTLTISSDGSLNLWNYVLPALTLVMEFNTGHSGYQDHPLLYVLSPLQFMIKALPFARNLAEEHEVHHLTMKKNYAPAFRVFDTWWGSNELPDHKLFDTADKIEPKFKGKKAHQKSN